MRRGRGSRLGSQGSCTSGSRARNRCRSFPCRFLPLPPPPIREFAETARVELMGALAANHMARQESKKAIPLLEQALERQLQREDLARKLRAAHMETGQRARAAELRKRHA